MKILLKIIGNTHYNKRAETYARMSVQQLALQSFRVIFLMRNKRGNWKVFQYCRRLSESGSGSRYSKECTQVTKSAIYFILLLRY